MHTGNLSYWRTLILGSGKFLTISSLIIFTKQAKYFNSICYLLPGKVCIFTKYVICLPQKVQEQKYCHSSITQE